MLNSATTKMTRNVVDDNKALSPVITSGNTEKVKQLVDEIAKSGTDYVHKVLSLNDYDLIIKAGRYGDKKLMSILFSANFNKINEMVKARNYGVVTAAADASNFSLVNYLANLSNVNIGEMTNAILTYMSKNLQPDRRSLSIAYCGLLLEAHAKNKLSECTQALRHFANPVSTSKILNVGVGLLAPTVLVLSYYFPYYVATTVLGSSLLVLGATTAAIYSVDKVANLDSNDMNILPIITSLLESIGDPIVRCTKFCLTQIHLLCSTTTPDQLLDINGWAGFTAAFTATTPAASQEHKVQLTPSSASTGHSHR
jgi:hypothetical protein